MSGQRRRRTSSPPRGSDAPSSTAGDDYVEVAARLQIKRGTAWPIFARYQRTGEVVRRPRGGALHHRLDDKSKDLLVMCLDDNFQFKLTLKHLALILQQSECRRRGRRCRYARRLASPHSPGRHLDCHTVGDRRSGCRSIPALKHVLARVRGEVRYLTCI